MERGQIDRQQTDNDRRQVITIAHHEPCSGELNKRAHLSKQICILIIEVSAKFTALSFV